MASVDSDLRPPRIHPRPFEPEPGDVESLDVWGFRDTAFQLSADGIVRLSGGRYDLSGREFPDLLAWVQTTIHPDISPDNLSPPHYPPPIPGPRRNPEFLDELRNILAPEQVSEDPELRLRHGHGHTLAEMYAIKYSRLERVPDLVVWPTEGSQVEALVEAALRHDVSLIPYGGGTNVTEALRCPAGEARPIVSVDMSRMNRILWIDPVNRMACIQAGAMGRQISEGLARHGFTMGHEPDSVEFSTLGGWIATHASGMKKNRYGNIEDLVLDISVVTARGRLERSGVAPRESVGSGDVRRWIFGSEGCLGIVTSAVVQIFPLPQVQSYGSIVFPDFESGVRFLYELQLAGHVPASVRLVDNMQFQLSQMLKPRSQGLRRLKSVLEKLLVTRVKGFDVEKMTACTLVFEGERAAVRAQQKQTYGSAKKHGGMAAGADNGRRGYQLTFAIAYIRDWVMNHWVMGESFETSVPWSRTLELCAAVKRRVREEYDKRGLPGKPFVSCRVTQVYATGVCVYFYFAFYAKGVQKPTESYDEIERAARDEVLRAGGSLSHHHGVGKIRQRFLPRIVSPGILAWGREIKGGVDPTNLFGAGNQLFPPPSADSIEA